MFKKIGMIVLCGALVVGVHVVANSVVASADQLAPAQGVSPADVSTAANIIEPSALQPESVLSCMKPIAMENTEAAPTQNKSVYLTGTIRIPIIAFERTIVNNAHGDHADATILVACDRSFILFANDATQNQLHQCKAGMTAYFEHESQVVELVCVSSFTENKFNSIAVGFANDVRDADENNMAVLYFRQG